MSDDLITLVHDGWQLVIWPELGGSLVSARRRMDAGWLDVKQPVTDEAVARRHPSWLGCYPLLPWCNRLDGGRFSFDGGEIQVPINRPELNLAIHGFGCYRPWQVTSSGEGHVELGQKFREAGNPYIYQAGLTYAVEGDALLVSLWVENAGERPLPFGIGLHPFFRRTPDTIVWFRTEGSFDNDPRKLPARAVDPGGGPDASLGIPATSLMGIDRGFFGWDGTAVLDWPEDGCRLRLSASESLRVLHLFVPADDRQAICLEPVSHVIDVVNRRQFARFGDMTVLGPGERLSGSMRVLIARD